MPCKLSVRSSGLKYLVQNNAAHLESGSDSESSESLGLVLRDSVCSRPARLWARARPLTRSRGSGCPSPSALSRAERSAASTAQRARVSAGGGTACQRGKGGRCKDMHFARRRGRGGDAGCGWAVLAPPGHSSAGSAGTFQS